jgi:uncharacterized protein
MITSLFVGLLGLLHFKISLDTINARGREKVSLGSGANNEIIHLVSAHSNFSSYTPIFLIMFYLLEVQSFSSAVLYLLGFSFLLGRTFHFLSMKDKEQVFKKRKLGMQLTLFPLIILSILNVYV